MVKAKWVDNKLVVEPVSKEEEAKVASFVQDTLTIGSVAVFEGVAYANDEQHAREQLEQNMKQKGLTVLKDWMKTNQITSLPDNPWDLPKNCPLWEMGLSYAQVCEILARAKD